jgi:hypothetical protein
MESNKPNELAIKLDWRFGILARLGAVRMKELMDFHRQAERHFVAAMKAWEKEVKAYTKKYGEDDGGSDFLIDKRGDIESLMDRGHMFGIVGLHTFFERFLNLVIEHLRSGGAPIPEPEHGYGLSLHKVREELLQHTTINMNRPPYDWKALERLREIRNCIVHADGWITDDFVTRLAKVGLTVKSDTRLKLPDNYFEKSWSLVDETYQAIYDECSKQFGHAKQEELWLRPTRTFSSDELRQILQEATDAGVAARELETKRLMKRAKTHGSREEDSCGWVWLAVDPKLLKHIHKLNIPNIDTSYNTTAIVEDFNLYLKDVRDTHRMCATSKGMEAAAAVLEKKGINSRIRSLTD